MLEILSASFAIATRSNINVHSRSSREKLAEQRRWEDERVSQIHNSPPPGIIRYY